MSLLLSDTRDRGLLVLWLGRWNITLFSLSNIPLLYHYLTLHYINFFNKLLFYFMLAYVSFSLFIYTTKMLHFFLVKRLSAKPRGSLSHYHLFCL